MAFEDGPEKAEYQLLAEKILAKLEAENIDLQQSINKIRTELVGRTESVTIAVYTQRISHGLIDKETYSIALAYRPNTGDISLDATRQSDKYRLVLVNPTNKMIAAEIIKRFPSLQRIVFGDGEFNEFRLAYVAEELAKFFE